MAFSQSRLCSLSSSHIPRRKFRSTRSHETNNFTCKLKIYSLFSFTKLHSAESSFKHSPRTLCQFSASGDEEYRNTDSGFPKVLGKRIGFVGSILPGGSWWSLPENWEDDVEAAKPMTVLLALRRMWELVSDEKWIIFVAFGSLAIAALSDVSIPSVLAASIFSAQSGETVVFSRNSQFIVGLCLTSGIFSGLRRGCLGILNVVMVKRLRENLYAALLFQDISYFDREKVGELTSRLGADCQRLSNIIGNDLHLILRNTLQGTGAVINLLALSWPLAMSTLVICFSLSAIFLVYGQYQRKTSRLTQDITASTNEVAQETLSLMRTVRAYGTEKYELGRYKQWLQNLVFINTRESVAFGFWNLSFSTLYRSTQIFAVLLGGMSSLSCCVTVEQLTNPLEHVKKFSR